MSSHRINMNRRQLYCRCFKLALDVFVCLFACVTELTDELTRCRWWGDMSAHQTVKCLQPALGDRHQRQKHGEIMCVQCSAESKVQPFSFHVCRIFHSCRVFPLMSANKDKLVLYLPFESSSASGEQREFMIQNSPAVLKLNPHRSALQITPRKRQETDIFLFQ